MWRMSCSNLVASVVLPMTLLLLEQDMQYFQTQFCQYFSTSDALDGDFSYGLHWKIICIALHMVLQSISCIALYLDMALYWSVLGSHLSFLVYPYSVSQIKLLCQDTTKMLLCLWHLCSACRNHLFNLHFFLLNIHYLECRNSSTSSFWLWIW